MIEIVQNPTQKARQPWHVRVVAEGNAQPILSGETLSDSDSAGTAVAALGRVFSPVDRAEYAAGVLTVWLDEDEHGEKLHIPVAHVEAETKPPAKRATKKATASAEGGDAK